MKKTLLLIFFLISVNEISAQWLDGYAYRKQITIQESQIPDGIDFMDFPVLINIASDPDLRDETNGGYVNNSDGWDLVFTASDGTTLLDHDVEYYDETSGEYVAWVKIPRLDHDDNTIIYLYFGYETPLTNPSKSTTWSNGFVSVYHLHDGFLDALGSNNGTSIGTEKAIGRAAYSQDFENDNSTDRIEIGNFDVLNDSITVSAWIKPESFDNVEARILSKAVSSAEQDHYWMLATINDGTELRFRLKAGGITSTHFSGPGVLSTGSWQYVAAVYDGNNMDLFYNGSQVGTPLVKSGIINTSSSVDVAIGNQPGSVTDWAIQKKPFDGSIDELRIISAARSSDWLVAEYNNQNAPGIFYYVGSMEEDLGTLIVSNTNDSGTGSLRQAIIEANANPGFDSIIFNIPGIGPHTINVGSVLPTITDTVVIDGTTQPDFFNIPIVRIDGAPAGSVSALTFSNTSDGSKVRGLMITRFTSNGIQIDLGADGITIAGNWIGTIGTGSTSVGNSNYGINVLGANTIIGGIGPYDGNVITNNGNEGINLSGSGATGTIIKGNIIGLDPDGSTGLGNSDVGIAILSGAHNTIIGGATSAERNVISKNYEGIEINSNNNVIQGNYIGTDILGTDNRGNRSDDGIEIQNNSTGNLIGGSGVGEGNLIAFNALDGIYVASGTDNPLLGNRIHSNTGLGIDLGVNGVTANDNGDGDIGANNLQNYPVLTTAIASGDDIIITGAIFSTSFTTYRIEFFSSPAGDGTGFGEGQTYLGYKSINTVGSGSGTINTTLTGVSVSVGSIVTATATVDLGGSYGSTSEFSAGVTVSLNPIIINKVTSNVSCKGGSDGAIDITVSGGTPDYSYSWSHGPITEDVGGLIAGDYTVTVTDANLNSLDSTFTITEPSLLNATLSSSGTSCLGSSDATITISTPGGGSGSYEYTIVGGDPWQTSGSFTNLSADTYDVRIRDALALSCEVILNSALDLTSSNDAIAPVILCPDNLSAVCNISEQPAYADYTAFTSAGGSATDNCSIDESSFILLSEVSDGLTCPETLSRTYQIADDNGNTATCQQDILINDITDPSFDTFPGNLTAGCDISEQPAYIDYAAFVADGGSASDNCSINPASFTLLSELSDGLSNPETVTRTYRIADLCGNTAIYIQSITITDDESPIIACLEDRIENLDNNCEFLIPDYITSLTVTDNCDPAPSVSQSPPAGTLLIGEGTTQAITIIATDIDGNSANCTFNIVLQDNTPPSISCFPDTIITTVVGIYDVLLSLGVPDVSDSCGIQSLTNDYSSASDARGYYPVGTTTVTYTATDLNGNNSQCSRQVIVKFGDDVPYGIVIPEGFSPNNDGLNDVFEIIGIEAYPDNELFVYNVWGKEVYYMAAYDNSWDGKASKGASTGKNLPTATYFYVLKLGNDQLVKGSVYLIIE